MDFRTPIVLPETEVKVLARHSVFAASTSSVSAHISLQDTPHRTNRTRWHRSPRRPSPFWRFWSRLSTMWVWVHDNY